jgi:hypothetical protein
MKINKKVMTFGILGFFALALVTGALLQYYGKIYQNPTIVSAVTLSGPDGINCDGVECTEPDVDGFSGDTLFSGVYTLTNIADTPKEVELKTSYSEPYVNPTSGEITTTYYTPSMDEIIAGADRLVLLQHETGSWDWVVTNANGPTDNSFLNIAGVTAQGLLTAYELTGNPDYLDVAIKTGDYLISEYGVGAGDATMFIPTSQGGKNINAFSVKFLYDLGRIEGNSIYTTYADTLMNEVITEYSTGSALLTANVNYRGTANGEGISMWDVYNYVENAETFGNSNWASQLVEAMNAYQLGSDDGTYTIGLAGIILATGNSDAVTDLISIQNEGGYFVNPLWTDEHIQPTAYAVMALMSVGESESALKGQVFLSDQSSNGVWLDGGVEYAEVDSEVIQTMLLTIELANPSGVIVHSEFGFIIANEFNTDGFDGTITTEALPAQ